MTAVVGILCQQGVVIGTDSSATFSSGQYPTVEQPMEKLDVIDSKVIVVGTGQVGLGQRFQDIIRSALSKNILRDTAWNIAKTLCRTAVEDFSNTHAKQGNYGALVAFPAQNKAHLCEFSVSDFQPEFKTEQMWYCSMGSTQTITDSFLALMRDLFWQSPPSVFDGIFAATWVLDHAVAVNVGGVKDPIRLAILEPTGNSEFRARFLSDAELGEHRQNIDGSKEAIREYCRTLHCITTELPNVPRPE